MSRVTYEVDPFNRVVKNDEGTKTGLNKFRKVIDGKFSVNENNDLLYKVKFPADVRDGVPRDVKLKGIWRFTKEHDLVLDLDEESRSLFSGEITLSGTIIDVQGDSLLFAVSCKSGANKESTYALTLKGKWQADKDNRLIFAVTKEFGDPDTLIFQNAWEINKNNEIIYKFEKKSLKTKQGKVHTIIFKGQWKVTDRARITYEMDIDSGSGFEFKTSVGILQENYIKYELGIRLANKASRERRIIELSGKWRIKRGIGLVFQIERKGKKAGSISFGAEVELDDKDNLLFKLKNDIEKRDLGISIRLSRKILKGEGEMFVNMIKSGDEKALYIGAAGKW